ncbi:hypothetical protein [Cellulomonas hominis]|nr:hypothetical protein [Cellulomonas hominis]
MSGGDPYDSIDEWLALSPAEKLARYQTHRRPPWRLRLREV